MIYTIRAGVGAGGPMRGLTYRATGLYRALRCSVIGRWAGFIWSAVINIDYRIPDDDTEA